MSHQGDIADPNALGTGMYAGMSLLHIAAFLGNAADVAMLLARGADIEAKSVYDYRTMPEAYQFISDAAAQRPLRQAGVVVEMLPSSGATPLLLAAGHRNPEAAILLMARGANINAKDNRYNTALHVAAEAGSVEVCRALIAAGAEVDTHRPVFHAGGDLRPLHLAARGGHARICELLLHAGAKVHQIGDGGTPLHLAAAAGELEACKILISHGADPDFREDPVSGKYTFYTPLQAAMDKDRVDVVKYFILECNANGLLEAPNGNTTERLARLHGRVELAALIRQAAHCVETEKHLDVALHEAVQEDGTPSTKRNRGLSPL